jgi:CHAD domain-containing protein
MSFRLEKKESVADGIHRVLREQTALALTALMERKGNLSGRIHEARRCLKRIRATLRLVRPHTDADTNDMENMAMRNAGRKLSGARDADVALATFERLVPQMSRLAVVRTRAKLKAAVRHNRRHAIPPGQLAAIALEVRASGHTISLMNFAENGWPLFAPGIRKSYASARHITRALREDTEIESIHDWRKATKRLLHQLELLQSALYKPRRKLLRRLGKLSEILGEHHDLITLAAHPAASKSPVLRGVITLKIARRLKKARRLAKEIFSSTPRTYLASIRAGWNDWRG